MKQTSVAIFWAHKILYFIQMQNAVLSCYGPVPLMFFCVWARAPVCETHFVVAKSHPQRRNFLFFLQSCIITWRRCKVVKDEMNWCWNCTALQLCLETPRTLKLLLSGIYSTNIAAVCSFRVGRAKYRTVAASGATIDRGCFTHHVGVKDFQTESGANTW